MGRTPSNETPALSWHGADLLIRVRLQPRASRERVTGMQGDAVKIAVTAPPVEGAANAALCALLARLLEVPKSHVSVEQGATGRDKRVRVIRANVQRTTTWCQEAGIPPPVPPGSPGR
ncbi:MAG: DUF167 family protein [Magnetococcus sp. WYHC-3]